MERESGLEILLVRHGRTAWNAERRFLGRTDLPLDEVGVAQAAALARELAAVPVDAVVASPLRRARQTASALAEEVAIVDALAELDQGELEGLAPEQAFARFGAFFAAWRDDPAAVVVPGGEGLADCRDRALEALRALARAHGASGRLVVVTHQLVIGSVCATVAGEPLRAWSRFTVDPCRYRRIRVDRDVWRLQRGPPDPTQVR